jgi:hypothetical protein
MMLGRTKVPTIAVADFLTKSLRDDLFAMSVFF